MKDNMMLMSQSLNHGGEVMECMHEWESMPYENPKGHLPYGWCPKCKQTKKEVEFQDRIKELEEERDMYKSIHKCSFSYKDGIGICRYCGADD